MKRMSFRGKAMALMAVILFTTGITQAAIKTAVNTGNWSTLTTWGNGNKTLPVPGDVININENVTVTVDMNVTIATVTLGSSKNSSTDAKLMFSSAAHYTLTITGDLNVGYSSSSLPTGSIDMTNPGTLNIGGIVIINKPGIWTSGAGTVNYSGTTNQALPSTWMTTYNNLTLSGSGTKTLPAALTVNGILSMEGTATVSTAPTYGPNATLQYNTPTARTNGVEWPSNFTASGGVKLINAGTITLDKSRTYTLPKLTIDAGNLILPAGGQVTVTGATTITPANGLTLLSDGSLTGSLITASASGSASVIRWMTPRRWHIVSSPVSGKTVGEFLTPNGNIPNNTISGHTSERGMRGYDPSLNQWGDFYTNASTEAMTKGKGYSVRVKGTNGTKDVTFSGTLNAGPVPVSGLEAGKWNCVGNPYTSALKMNSTGTTDNFIDVNASNLDMNYGGIYIWHQAEDEQVNENSGVYEPLTNVSDLSEVQQGQAFMVKMASAATALDFTHAMQSHNTGLELKSTGGVWPTIQLTAAAESITSSTIIAFHEGMTPGLDPTYDAGLLKGGASLEVYTRLVEDNGIPFDIQALPADDQSTVVPVGIDCTKGSQVSFSARLIHLPSACQVLLEDRLNKVFTDLSISTYTADLKGSTSSQGRFFLHTSYSTTGMDPGERVQEMRAWAVKDQEIRISGQVTSKAKATLYDLQGRAVAVNPLQEGTLNSVPLKGLKQGVYMLRVQDESRARVLKVTISK